MDDIFDELVRFGQIQDQMEQEFALESEKLWNSLDERHRLMLMCYIAKQMSEHILDLDKSPKGFLIDGLGLKREHQGMISSSGFGRIYKRLTEQ